MLTVLGYFPNGCLIGSSLFPLNESRDCAGMLNLLPNSNTISSVISACVMFLAATYVFVGSAVVDLYDKCGYIFLA